MAEKFRRGFNDIKREVQQELHNDEVMQELKQTGEKLKREANAIGQSVSNTSPLIEQEDADLPNTGAAPAPPADKDQQ